MKRLKYLRDEGFYIGGICLMRQMPVEGDEWKGNGFFLLIVWADLNSLFHRELIPVESEAEFHDAVKLFPGWKSNACPPPLP